MEPPGESNCSKQTGHLESSEPRRCSATSSRSTRHNRCREGAPQSPQPHFAHRVSPSPQNLGAREFDPVSADALPPLVPSTCRRGTGCCVAPPAKRLQCSTVRKGILLRTCACRIRSLSRFNSAVLQINAPAKPSLAGGRVCIYAIPLDEAFPPDTLTRRIHKPTARPPLQQGCARLVPRLLLVRPLD